VTKASVAGSVVWSLMSLPSPSRPALVAEGLQACIHRKVLFVGSRSI
jgi:hypothetical protein